MVNKLRKKTNMWCRNFWRRSFAYLDFWYRYKSGKYFFKINTTL